MYMVHGGFAGNQKRQQNRYQPYSTNWKHGQEASQTGGAAGKDMPAWKSFGGRGRARVESVPVAWSADCVLNVPRQDFSVTVQPPVLCPVVSPLHSILNVQMQSQKKDISLSSKLKRESDLH